MTNIIEKIEIEEMSKKVIPELQPGYTVSIGLEIKEGERTRIQYFEGVVIAKSNRQLRSTITVRKISYGVAVERVIPLYSPSIDSIKVTRKGRVRRAKLYYLRNVSGKKARLKEKN